MMVQSVINGPYMDEESSWWLVCMVYDSRGELVCEEIEFKDFNSAYNFENMVDLYGPIELDDWIDDE
jgi:hypothetical protein